MKFVATDLNVKIERGAYRKYYKLTVTYDVNMV